MIKHVKGNIVNIDADIIVNSANTDLNHNNGIAKVIAEAAGYKLTLESENLGKVPVGELAMTGGGNLKAHRIYHIPTIDLSENICISYEDLEKVWRKALTWCKANQFESIAAPLLGINCGLEKQKVKELMVKVGEEYQFDHLEIIIVDHGELEEQEGK
ncbi:MAG: macro domain-containing protein [Candidatus Spechtbacterales bacterium]|nr:macro domain-containing protein [Candidatus Spechtbacterales bacterium]